MNFKDKNFQQLKLKLNISNKGWLTNATKFVVRNPITSFLNLHKKNASKTKIKNQLNMDNIFDLIQNNSTVTQTYRNNKNEKPKTAPQNQRPLKSKEQMRNQTELRMVSQMKRHDYSGANLKQKKLIKEVYSPMRYSLNKQAITGCYKKQMLYLRPHLKNNNKSISMQQKKHEMYMEIANPIYNNSSYITPTNKYNDKNSQVIRAQMTQVQYLTEYTESNDDVVTYCGFNTAQEQNNNAKGTTNSFYGNKQKLKKPKPNISVLRQKLKIKNNKSNYKQKLVSIRMEPLVMKIQDMEQNEQDYQENAS